MSSSSMSYPTIFAIATSFSTSLSSMQSFTPLIIKRVGIQHHRSDYRSRLDTHDLGNYTRNQ